CDATSRKLSRFPEYRRASRFTTRFALSRFKRSRRKCEPINPAPPVTRILIATAFSVSFGIRRQLRSALGEGCKRLVFRRQQRRRDGPGNAQRGIVPNNSALILRHVKVGAFVHHRRRFAHHTVAMGKPGRNIELSLVLSRELDTVPLAEKR